MRVGRTFAASATLAWLLASVAPLSAADMSESAMSGESYQCPEVAPEEPQALADYESYSCADYNMETGAIGDAPADEESVINSVEGDPIPIPLDGTGVTPLDTGGGGNPPDNGGGGNPPDNGGGGNPPDNGGGGNPPDNGGGGNPPDNCLPGSVAVECLPDAEVPKGNNGVGNGEDPQPPGNPPINDGPGTPGNPGNKGVPSKP